MVLAGLLLTLRNFGRRIIIALPFPDRVLELYDRFEEGVFSAITVRQLPPLVVLTTFIWATEGLRLYFVVQALGFDDVSLGISGAVFVALIGSLLTAVPFSPAGLGVVDAGMGAVLVLAYGIPATEATTIVVVDRVISVFSIIVFGSILYVFSGKRKGEGLSPVNGVHAAAGPVAGLTIGGRGATGTHRSPEVSRPHRPRLHQTLQCRVDADAPV